ncbi:hypothetical protein OS190_06155 [Sulfitobacter sp. F26204]|uniref:hypothetical protein n=1 Tax=Sulfitobacter sp. F26204 TaxID=2996014 RepID=UPI00225DDC1D|nr:hypothetical protein [Sulfitobacter sp. F26204]MCX7559145.1 hypothetical protein [Sulfitobacter sp. F26204]
MKFGTNTLLLKFDQFLRENGKVGGIAFFDQTTDFKQLQYFREIFQFGMEFKETRKRLEHIVSIDNTGTNHSHLSSITDIVVGAFRFVANEPDKDKVGTVLVGLLGKLMWGVRGHDGVLQVAERGLCIRPKSISHIGHQADIRAFRDRLNLMSQNASKPVDGS